MANILLDLKLGSKVLKICGFKKPASKSQMENALPIIGPSENLKTVSRFWIKLKLSQFLLATARNCNLSCPFNGFFSGRYFQYGKPSIKHFGLRICILGSTAIARNHQGRYLFIDAATKYPNARLLCFAHHFMRCFGNGWKILWRNMVHGWTGKWNQVFGHQLNLTKAGTGRHRSKCTLPLQIIQGLICVFPLFER